MARILDFTDGFTSASAPSVAGSGLYTVQATQSITASGTITPSTEGLQVLRVQGSGGAQVASSTPFGASPSLTDQTIIKLEGQSDTNTLQISRNDATDGCLLNGDAVLFDGYILTLRWDATRSRFLEDGRNF